jgi:hypothetical protein
MKIKSAGSTLTAVTLAVIGLAACGGSNNDNGNNSSSPTPTLADAFFAQVASIVATSPDNTEPVSIDAIVATSPEDAEPSAIL